MILNIKSLCEVIGVLNKQSTNRNMVLLDLRSSQILSKESFRQSKMAQIAPHLSNKTESVAFPMYSPPSATEEGHFWPVQIKRSGEIFIYENKENFEADETKKIEEICSKVSNRILENLPEPSDRETKIVWRPEQNDSSHDCGPLTLWKLENLQRNVQDSVSEKISIENIKSHFSLLVQNVQTVPRPKKAVRFLQFD